jgi:CBS domain-containing protein
VDFKLELDSEPVESAHPAAPIAVEPETPLRDVLALLKSQCTGGLLICREGKLIGIFTERDAVRLMAKSMDLAAPIESVMTRNPATLKIGETMSAAIRKMSAGGYRRMPIIDEHGQPTGMVKVSGIVRYLVDHFPKTVYNLPPEPNTVMQEREGA